jgi:hypothetical protein
MLLLYMEVLFTSLDELELLIPIGFNQPSISSEQKLDLTSLARVSDSNLKIVIRFENIVIIREMLRETQ